ncbi:hypothetical protein [Roseiflexus castenholzii]|jgi:hypothetical protein|uniref:Uncharacterized protein n=1 Tax=Roseiflexus castenholzii (strain DSM 13941 / HLO8) TaxID=383372 RepID=A7NG55_ROSCS|nr:hypothetical protein [Roseiflexus castenholzii]ABU56442.1 hypothetical protein Rcas_0309 [Roseiflexus castenholzii DSM 13941]
MPFRVIVADNVRFMDERENYEYGTFDGLEAAIAAAKQIVDECLESAYTPAMSAADLYQHYVNFGEEPYIIAEGFSGVLFSAWDYARERCAFMCSPDREGSGNEEQNEAVMPDRSFQPTAHSSLCSSDLVAEPDRSALGGMRGGAIALDAAGVTYASPDGTSQRVEWADLRTVEVITTDSGPFAEDVFWRLHGDGPPLLIPQSASGSDSLLARLQELPGFDNRAVIAAMSSVGNERFLCWMRS